MVQYQHAVGYDGADFVNVSSPSELSLLEIPEHGRGGSRRRITVLQTHRVKRGDIPSLAKPGGTVRRGELASFPGHDRRASACPLRPDFREHALLPARHENFPRGKRHDMRDGLVRREGSRIEFSRTRSEKGYRDILRSEVGCREAPFLGRVLRHVGARCDDADHFPLHQILAVRLRHLIANGHPQTGRYETSYIGVKRVMRHSGHRNRPVLIACRERDIQYLRRFDGVVEKHLEKIPHSKQKNTVRVFILPFSVLREHRSHLYAFRQFQLKNLASSERPRL